MGNLTKGLINAFNLNNYFSDKINTNFTVEGKKIVGLFAGDINIEEYLQGIGEKIIKRHYLSGTEVAGAFYNLNCFPFVLGANADKEDLGNGIVKVKLADSTDPAVIHNLKINFANEFERAVISKVVARLQKAGVTEEEAYKWIRGTVQTGAIGSPYLYCIAFSDGYLYDSETFEVVKAMYIEEFNSRLKECHVKSSDFYEYKNDMLYIKDVSDKVVKSVAEYVKKEVALDFRTPGSIESKVENCKNVLNDLIFKITGKSTYGYDYDDFIDEKKIRNGSSFALIPFIEENGQLKSLSPRDASKINGVFNKEISNVDDNFISDIRGKTANPQFANCKEPVYAFSNKQIAQLLPKIMESPIAYNQINGCFEFAVDLENFKRRGSSRSSSTVTSPFNSPTHACSSGLETPPNSRKRNRDSGLGDSPPRPEDSVAHSSSSDPRSSFEEIQEPQSCFPRQGALLYHNVGAAEVVAAENVPAGTSAWSQPMDPWSSSASSAGLSLCQPSRPSSWKGASESGSAWTSQPIGFWSSSALSAEPSLCSQSGPSSSRGASESMRIGRSTWYVSSSGVEDVNDVEHEKQQVSDGCSEAKSQDSKSPKKHGGGLLCKERWSTLTKFSPFKRRSVERDTMCSSKSDLVHHVTKKPPLSERSASARKAKSNPPSGVTSPTHEGAPGGLKPLTSDERKELRPFLPPELRKKLDSHSFLPGEEQHLYLTHTLSGKRELSRSLCEGEQSQLLRLTKAQLPDNSSSKKVDRDSGFCSMGSPAVLHKGSVSSELKHPQQVKHMSEALGK